MAPQESCFQGGFSTSQPAALLCLLYTADFSFQHYLMVSLKLQTKSLETGAAWSQGKATEEFSPLERIHSPAGCIYQCSIP